jgi:hypothetical protein
MSGFYHTLDERIEVLDRLVDQMRRHARGAGNQEAAIAHDVLKELAKELRARRDLPRGRALDEMEAAVSSSRRAAASLQHETGKLMNVAILLIHHWPIVRQALERLGKENTE